MVKTELETYQYRPSSSSFTFKLVEFLTLMNPVSVPCMKDEIHLKINLSDQKRLSRAAAYAEFLNMLMSENYVCQRVCAAQKHCEFPGRIICLNKCNISLSHAWPVYWVLRGTKCHQEGAESLDSTQKIVDWQAVKSLTCISCHYTLFSKTIFSRS